MARNAAGRKKRQQPEQGEQIPDNIRFAAGRGIQASQVFHFFFFFFKITAGAKSLLALAFQNSVFFHIVSGLQLQETVSTWTNLV